jgi:hypothetical protein
LVIVSIEIPAPRSVVWDEVARLADHVEWMADAESIEFLGDQTEGVGTRMRVATRFGPLRTSDVMEFTSWEPHTRMGVEHRGLFTGSGEFLLEDAGLAATRFTWRERIVFPWFFGGPVGAFLARPVFGWVWRRNLRRLRERISDR